MLSDEFWLFGIVMLVFCVASLLAHYENYKLMKQIKRECKKNQLLKSINEMYKENKDG